MAKFDVDIDTMTELELGSFLVGCGEGFKRSYLARADVKNGDKEMMAAMCDAMIRAGGILSGD